MKIPCALVESRITNKPTKCQYESHPCMHRLKGRCCWVESGDVEEFASRRGVSGNKFLTEAKKASVNIKLIVLIDKFYEYVRERYKIYPKSEERLPDLDFPFDFPGHVWSEELLVKIMDDTVVDSFVKDLPDKSIEFFEDARDYVASYFENDN